VDRLSCCGQNSVVSQPDADPGSDAPGGRTAPSPEVAELLDHNARVVDFWHGTWPWLAPLLGGTAGAIWAAVVTHGSIGDRVLVGLLGFLAGAAAALRFARSRLD